MFMQVLLIDRSGRGHAFADLLSRTNPDVLIHYVPGCSAVVTPRVIAAPSLSLSEPRPILEYARRQGIDFVLVTHTQALADGFVDAFREAGLPVIGPDRDASRLEWSKIYAKDLFRKYGIPSPEHVAFSDPEAAKTFVRTSPYTVVVKADGLCGGNGAFVCNDETEALTAIDRLMVQRIFGKAGESIVVERRLYGREVSFFALIDGESYLMLPMALDYPKSDDGNRGVISGGMGALCPHPLESADLTGRVETKILQPLLRLIAAEGLRYTGVIYLGCLLVGDEPVLLEVNARMGDPEAEVVFPRLESDFLAICQAILGHRLGGQRLILNDRCFCDVVATQGPTPRDGSAAAADSYPGWPFGEFGRHYPVTGVAAVDESRCKVFLGETTVQPGKGLVSDGGRVVHVVGCGSSVPEAVAKAYEGIEHIHFAGMRYRRDIGRVLPWES